MLPGGAVLDGEFLGGDVHGGIGHQAVIYTTVTGVAQEFQSQWSRVRFPPRSLFVAVLALMIAGPAFADARFCGFVPRAKDGSVSRSQAVLREFRRQHPKPKDGRVWIMDHVVPLDCGGCDAVENLQWLPVEQWRDKSKWERKVYGGNGLSNGCP